MFLLQVELKSEFFSMQAPKPKLVKLMDCLNTLPRSLKIPLHKDLSGECYSKVSIIRISRSRLLEFEEKEVLVV